MVDEIAQIWIGFIFIFYTIPESATNANPS